MAFFREYDYNEDSRVLVLFFYMDYKRSEPDLVIRLQTDSLSCSISRRGYSVNRCIVVEELKRLYELIEEPYWKSFVLITSSRDHRIRNYELF